MSELDPQIIAADGEAHVRRAAFLAALTETKERLAPASLKKEASDAALDAALRGVADAKAIAREHPGKLMAFAALVGALAARRPLGSLLHSSFVKARNHWQARRADPDADEDEHGPQD